MFFRGIANERANYSVQSRYGPDYFDYGRKTSEFGMLKFDIDAGIVTG
jgi:hypothetical protein